MVFFIFIFLWKQVYSFYPYFYENGRRNTPYIKTSQKYQKNCKNGNQHLNLLTF